jgi:hypothetical protein
MNSQTVLAIAASCSALAAACSASALLINVWKQSIKSKKPDISLLNDVKTPQRARLVPYDKMPQSIRRAFPDYKGSEAKNAALVRLLFSNSGNGDGFITIDEIQAINLPDWKASYYTQNIVGAKAYCIHDIVLRGIPNQEADKDIYLKVKISWGPAREAKTIDANVTIKLTIVGEFAGGETNRARTERCELE